MTARFAAIFQLCLAFSIILWNGGYPFMGELFEVKSQTLLYQTVMGVNTSSSPGEYLEHLDRNKNRFAKLTHQQQHDIAQHYQQTRDKAGMSFLEKTKKALQLLAFDIPAFERAWLLFAIVISILILLNRQGAAKAAWLLPVLALCYAIDNQLYEKNFAVSAEVKLFPSEELIVNHYLREPLGKSIAEQQQQLMRGWKNYLVEKWADEVPSKEPEKYAHQVEEGEYAFNVARAEAVMQEDRSIGLTKSATRKEPIFYLALYLVWNIIFALAVNTQKRK